MKKLCGCVLVLWSAFMILSGACFGVTSEELRDMLESHEEVTLIDTQGNAAFSDGHIPGAINVPARLCAVKAFPPLGRVVVYGDGYDETPVSEAVEAMNEKPGIRAEKLDGGLARWEALGYPSTRKAGFEGEGIHYVTIEELGGIARSNPDLVILDLREENTQPLQDRLRGRSGGSGREGDSGKRGLTDLSAVFPGVKIMRSLTAGVKASREHSELYVLIDSADGTAEKAALQLKAAGIKRFAVLTGGEESIRAK